MYILRYIRFCKPNFSIKLFHFWLRKGGVGIWTMSIFNLNDREEILLKNKMHFYSFVHTQNWQDT
jgi:hypothetical protein